MHQPKFPDTYSWNTEQMHKLRFIEGCFLKKNNTRCSLKWPKQNKGS